MRRASALPAVLIVLVIAVTLGATMFFTTRGGYRSTARAAYRLRLQMFMVSALDEARTRLFQLTSPNSGGLVITRPGLRNALLDRIPVPRIPWQEGDEPDPYNNEPDLTVVDFEVPLGDFDGNPILWASQAIQFVDVPDNPPEYMGRIEILEAKARLHGFRRVKYDDEGQFPQGFDYYQNAIPFEDNMIWHRDYVGYCTITIHARLRGGGSNPLNMQRRIQVTHDVKVVDTRPPARDFALFAFRSTVGHDDRIYKALNEGGANGNVQESGEFDPENPPSGRLIVYPQAVGRIYIRGPYVMLVEGRTDGRGGDNPMPGPSYPGGRYSDWGGWSQVPGPRGVTLPFKATAFGGWPSPVRPENACTTDGSVSLGVPAVNHVASAYARDPAGFGVTTPMAASSFGPNRQRLLLSGEPGCYDGDHESCSADAFRGMLQHRPDQIEEGSDTPPVEVWQPFYPMNDDGSAAGPVIWPTPDNGSGEDMVKNYDQVVVEGGPQMLGLYSIYKVYPFIAGEGCPRPGWFDSFGAFVGNVGRVVGDAADFVAELGTLGGYMTASYRRNPPTEQQGLVVNWDDAKMREVAALPFGLENLGEPAAGEEAEEWFKERAPFLMMLPYAMHYQSPEDLGWLRSVLTAVVDVVAITAMFVLPGPGILVNSALRGAFAVGARTTGRMGTRAALGASFGRQGLVSNYFRRQGMGSAVIQDLAAFSLVEGPAIGAGINYVSGEPNAGDPSNLGSRGVSSVTSDALQQFDQRLEQEMQEQARLDSDLVSGLNTGEENSAVSDIVRQVGSFELVLRAFSENGELWDRAADDLDSMMTGLPPRQAGGGLAELRETETFGQDTDRRTISALDTAYFGFLPSRLKPYQRLATKWYRNLEDALVGDRVLPLEGVLAFDRYPQEDDDAPDSPLRFVGRGAIVSTAGPDPGGENQKPTFRGGIEPMDPANDYLTLVYWTQLPMNQARGKNGTGMVSLDSVQNWASVVANYGVRPLSSQVGIRGNLVTYFLDRNRFPDSANLRVFYRWDALRPDIAGDERAEPQDSIHSEEQVRPWVSVSVSPKIAGWYDSVE